MKTLTQQECVFCGKIEVRGYWYRPYKAPPHDPSYKGAICPDCEKKRADREVKQ